MIRNNSSTLEAAGHPKHWDFFILWSLQNNQNNLQRNMLLFIKEAQININVMVSQYLLDSPCQPGSRFLKIEVRIAVVSIDTKLLNMNKTLTYTFHLYLLKHMNDSVFCFSETGIASYFSNQYRLNKSKTELSI
jgi:hypothetical protein